MSTRGWPCGAGPGQGVQVVETWVTWVALDSTAFPQASRPVTDAFSPKDRVVVVTVWEMAQANVAPTARLNRQPVMFSGLLVRNSHLSGPTGQTSRFRKSMPPLVETER